MYKSLKLKTVLAVFAITVVAITATVHAYKSIETGVVKPDYKAEESSICLPVIMYHSVVDNPQKFGEYVVSPKTLENDLAYLAKHDYTFILMQDLYNYVENGVQLPEKPVMLTFDDGFYNNMSVALPILEKYNAKAVFSVVGEYTTRYSLEENAERNNDYSYLTWNDIKKLVATNRIEIGNHTYFMHSHAQRDGCKKRDNESLDDYKLALQNDIGRLQQELTENSGVTPTVFTYPFGAISPESTAILREMGFKSTFNCREKANYITRDPDCLYGIFRYNRPYGITTEEFMSRALQP